MGQVRVPKAGREAGGSAVLGLLGAPGHPLCSVPGAPCSPSRGRCALAASFRDLRGAPCEGRRSRCSSPFGRSTDESGAWWAASSEVMGLHPATQSSPLASQRPRLQTLQVGGASSINPLALDLRLCHFWTAGAWEAKSHSNPKWHGAGTESHGELLEGLAENGGKPVFGSWLWVGSPVSLSPQLRRVQAACGSRVCASALLPVPCARCCEQEGEG